MAAIDLELGLERGGRGWGPERPELMDNFDSEMQEWEDQLQDIQRKIEELYSEVQARRGVNDIAGDNQKNGSPLECGLRHHGDSLFGPSRHSVNHPGDIIVHHCGPNGCSYPVSHQDAYSYCRSSGVSEIGDLLQDYLENGKKTSRKNNGARHVHFSDTVKVNQDFSAYQDGSSRRSGNNRLGPDHYTGTFEETENRKNRGSHMKSAPCRESSPTKENTTSKPPVGQRDVTAVQSRLQFPATVFESPVDRKSFSQGVLGDRKCTSPSVLKKFGAMLQENEGKTLTESGVVTHQGLEAKCPTAGCQRRALGATGGASKAPVHVAIQKCQGDCGVPTAERDPGQEWASGLDCRHKDQRGGYSSSKGSQAPQQVQRRPQVPGSPKIRPRANSGVDRDGGSGQVEKTRKPTVQQVEPKVDYRPSNVPSGSQRIPRGQELPGCGHIRDEGLIELLDMLEIQHEYSSSPRTGHTAYKQEPQHVNPAELSPAKPRKSFSRPARPANQRPPSRWANRTPTARIASPSGPIYCALPRTSSPALKHRPLISYSFQTETVIM
uniref:SOGA 1/2-like coiled-coil domain-containing protein n=1 Tax=Iconisemion striatum TaxID=60296 RepID=A0A1A7YPN3_9TELE